MFKPLIYLAFAFIIYQVIRNVISNSKFEILFKRKKMTKNNSVDLKDEITNQNNKQVIIPMNNEIKDAKFKDIE
jgi:hypothetical protein